ncbi:MAG: proline--tRNA ligase [Kiloniellales bacterium]|nr:proline--tRNA ligase [Kiloniellales bacterium]
MKFSTSGIRVMRNFPAEAEVASHKWLVRAGYIFQHGSGIYSFAPLFYRVYKKIREIVEAEIDREGGVQVQLPLIQPAELWERSGRLEVYRQAGVMFETEDRKGSNYCLCPTAEEVVTDLAMGFIQSHRQLPVNFYQQHTKFRDELRPRFGLVRCREFVMMDAYSFDIDEAGLDASYQAMARAYHRVFQRCGLDYVVVQADSGAIGGSASEEFMAACDIGEDLLLIAGDYAANAERAVSVIEDPADEDALAMEVVETPGANTIAKLADYLRIPKSKTLKCLVFKAVFSDREEPVVVLVRGDGDVNEVKLQNHLEALAVKLADDDMVQEVAGCSAGYVGPTTLRQGAKVIADLSVKPMKNFAAGSGEADRHAVNVNHGRDFPTPEFVDIRMAKAGEKAPNGEILESFRGIEVGHIFKLGDKYSIALNAGVNDSEGVFRHFQMGCYGIGTTRIASAVVEQHHDEAGMTWPIAIAPFHLHFVPTRYQDEDQQKLVDGLYEDLRRRGIEVLLDDRKVSPGVKFADADAIGVPFRVTFGRGLAEGKVELKERKLDEARELPLEALADTLEDLVKGALA